MPNQTTSKRIPISLKPELYDLISDLAELQNKPMSRVIVDLVEETKPALVLLRDAIKEVRESDNKEDVLKRLGASILLDGTEQLGKLSREIKDL